MYKSLYALILTLLISLPVLPPAALAAPGDTREKMAGLYGEYRLVNDTEGKLWSRADWESSKAKRGGPESYVYFFARLDTRMTTVAAYDKRGGDHVALQHFSFDTPISVGKFKEYFPEVYALITDTKAKVFIINSDELNSKFLEEKNTISFGVVVEKEVAKETGYYTVMSFNIRDNGRLVKDAQYIDGNTAILEFIMEKFPASDARDKLYIAETWKPVKNYFLK
jgi:hypothetical protein